MTEKDENSRATDRDRLVVEEQVTRKRDDKRAEDDTIRHTLHEVASKASIDLEQAREALKLSAERSEKEARSLLLESRRTRMASRPGMKRPFIK